ncbi:MAG TPA: hypothetical protein VGQ57_09290 [Polyangiaceae bacterium]|nr:hypothetical protein [Polyangiaceae bacterium]
MRLAGSAGQWVAAAGWAVTACGGSAVPSPGPSVAPRGPVVTAAAGAKLARGAGRCTYRVGVTAREPWRVKVHARCEGTRTTAFALSEPASAAFVTTPLTASRPAPGVAELDYSVDLDGLARDADDFDVARLFGKSLVAPASSFLLTPAPPEDGVPIRVVLEDSAMETGLRQSGDAFVIESHELRVATYTTFGARQTRDLPVGSATLRLAVLDGALDLGVDELARWVTEAATGVATFFHRPPEARTLVVLAPLPNRHGVAFGKLLPESGPGVIVLIGEHTTAAELRDDWVLVHELFHVGTPSYQGEGKWYDEGLATYFEPLIRTRMGWRSESATWHEFLREMPRGVPAMTERGLEHPEGYSDVYWGGAVFCLLADVAERRSTGGARGLEDGVRAVLEAGGVASEVWSLARATDMTDRALGSSLFSALASAHAEHGTPVELDELFRALGVRLDARDQIVFDDRAPLAGVRQALIHGAPP